MSRRLAAKELDKNRHDLQMEYIEKVRLLNDGKQKHMYIATFGCQMNAHDSEMLIGMLTSMGYSQVESEKDADLILYNTCCVRENAENKVYGNLGFLKGLKVKNPNLIIALCGCMMQQDTVIEKIMSSYKNVDIIFGTFNLYRFPELLYTRLITGGFVIDVWDEHEEIVGDMPTERAYKYKASVNIMYGCNNFCSYCIVPYVRGRERSRPSVDILKEIKDLVLDGVIEVTLLGQNVNSYGKELEENISFAGLLRKINEIEGLKRIRFMTSHPKDLSDELIYAIRDCEKICKHLHLPFQSGSSSILEKMNRKYTKEGYLSLIDKIKDNIPGILISTDIIVGFPGETEDDFLDTLDVVKKVGFSTAFTFLYSKRTGTPAAAMAEQVPENITKKRFNRLLEVLNSGIFEISSALVGERVEVLAEEVNDKNETLLTGRTDGNFIVHFAGSKSDIGKIVGVEITGCKTFYLTGRRI